MRAKFLSMISGSVFWIFGVFGGFWVILLSDFDSMLISCDTDSPCGYWWFGCYFGCMAGGRYGRVLRSTNNN